ncbi:MAG: hypothetical protein DMG11_01950 [Acidobacteria bacterium]|nr:MAG: hypothetical protein DMG11_01950 [Acidobacteriota bacterium]
MLIVGQGYGNCPEPVRSKSRQGRFMRMPKRIIRTNRNHPYGGCNFHANSLASMVRNLQNINSFRDRNFPFDIAGQKRCGVTCI